MASIPFTIIAQSGPSTPGGFKDFEVVFARRAMMKIRRLMGDERLKELLKEEIAEADTYWKKIASESDGKWRAARIVISPRGLTSKEFLTWFVPRAGEGDTPEKIAVHPEHWVIDTKKGMQGIYVLETLGDKVTQCTLRDEGKGAPEFVAVDESCPMRFGGSLVTYEGTHMAEAFHQFKDHEDGKGFTADLAIYFPAACEEEIIETHRQHLLVEFTNWMQMAYTELKEGK